MGYASQLRAPKTSLRGTLGGDGRPGPIEERIGRRLVRLVDPESVEGSRLLDTGDVDLIGPDGGQLGRVRLAEAYRALRARMERRLAGPAEVIERGVVEDGLERLRGWERRLGARQDADRD